MEGVIDTVGVILAVGVIDGVVDDEAAGVVVTEGVSEGVGEVKGL